MIFEFNKTTLDFLRLILKAAHKADLRVFFVGGIVRDNILGIKNDDIDLLVEGSAIEFSNHLPSEIVVKSIHQDFGTVKVKYPDLNVDIASTRAESYPYSGCLPVVDKIGVPLELDVKRRDFTVNSMYCELKEDGNEIKFELIDLVEGQKDIKNKVLRVLHDKSYIDDPTRIFRGLNFKNRFNFDFSDSDNELIKQFLKNINLENASTDRLLSVFLKNLKTDFALNFLKESIEKGYSKIVFQNDINPDFTRLSEIITRFNLKDNLKSEFLVQVIQDESVQKQDFQNLLELKKFFDGFNIAELAYYYYKTNETDVQKYLEIKDIKLLVTGCDLIKQGFKEGVIFKQIFDKLLLKKLENPQQFSSKEDELAFVKSEFPQT